MQTGGHDKLKGTFHNFANTPKQAWPVGLHLCTNMIMQTMSSEVYAAYMQKMAPAYSLDYF